MSAAAPAMPHLEQLIDAVATRVSFGLLWNGDEPKELKFMSQLMEMPKRDEIAPSLAGWRDRPVLDADGDPIPGSLIIEDLEGDGPDEGRIVFSAKKAITNWMGLPEKLDRTIFRKPPSKYAEAGLRLLPRLPTKAQIKEVRKDGELAWENYKDILAKNIIKGWHRHKQLFGSDAQPFDDEYMAAERRLRARSEKLDMQDKIRLGIEQEKNDLGTDDLELRVLMEGIMMEQLTAMGVESTQTKLATVKKLIEDPRIRKQLQKDYRIRKVGHTFERDEALEAAEQTAIIEEAKSNAALLKEADAETGGDA